MSVLSDLQRQRGLYARCPNCEGEFRLADAGLFEATKTLSERALQLLADRRDELKGERAKLVKRRESARTRPRIAAESVNIGKVVEKIAPSLPGFPVASSDCRSLFEPIDYIVFRGLSAHGRVDSLLFVDVKSGKSRLSATQSQIRSAVERGRVSLVVAKPGKVREP
jgi:predicted Holliday junction resolvase-like endonuclease